MGCEWEDVVVELFELCECGGDGVGDVGVGGWMRENRVGEVCGFLNRQRGRRDEVGIKSMYVYKLDSLDVLSKSPIQIILAILHM